MRILLYANHQYPAGGKQGTGLSPNESHTGGSAVVHDLLAKGLAELGHEVFYWVKSVPETSSLPGVTFVSDFVPDVDILHHYNSQFSSGSDAVRRAREFDIPWVATCHSDPESWPTEAPSNPETSIRDNWIFVSKTQAARCGRKRVVINGVDPADYLYADTKKDYFFFMCRLARGNEKGLEIALSLSQKQRIPLVVAGSFPEQSMIREFAERCLALDVEYVGDVRGEEKARWFAGAKALLFPTQVHEACGLVVLEALMSGTPVISSDRGACSELVSPDVGVVCKTWDDYVAAFDKVGRIAPRACRDKAMREFNYLRMAQAYVREYEKEMR